VADYIDLLQWPAMVVTVCAAWLVASRSAGRRKAGFWVFLLSNVLWTVWGWHAQAYALIALQVALAAMNIRGAYKNEAVQRQEEAQPARSTGPARQQG
jgi:hypothetical protein